MVTGAVCRLSGSGPVEHLVRQKIFDLIDPEYQKFSSKLNPGTNNILGVRLPELRKIAKNIAKGNWRDYFETAQDDYFEEIMLQGLVIGYIKTDIEGVLSQVDLFVPKIHNWSVCDSFCIGLKITNKHKERVWEFIQPYLQSGQEYEVRFGVVMLLNYYLEGNYIDKVLGLLDHIKHDGYYVKMAVAWAISASYIKAPDITIVYLKNNTLDDFTFNRALQKISESLRVDKETKKYLRGMKRK